MREKITKIIIVILVIILAYKIVEISAAYKSGIQADINGNIQPWVIKINETDITTTETAETKTFALENIEIIQNTANTIAEGKIAPGTTVKIPITIDASETGEFDVRYDINVGDIKLKDNSEATLRLRLKAIEEKDNTKNYEIIQTAEKQYSAIITETEKDTNNKIHEVNIILVWEEDSEENEEHNNSDSEIGTNLTEQIVEIPVIVIVSQCENGETLMEYTEGNIES